MKITTETAPVVSREVFEWLQGEVSRIEDKCEEWLVEQGWDDPDTAFSFEWDYCDLGDGRVLLFPYVSYQDGIGYPYLNGNDDRLATLLDEHKQPYESIPVIDRATLIDNPYVHGGDRFAVTDEHNKIKLHCVGDVI